MSAQSRRAWIWYAVIGVASATTVALLLRWTKRDDFKLIGIEGIKQKRTNWCWAASAELVMKSVCDSCAVPQCQQATEHPENTAHVDCCHPGCQAEADSCNRSGWPDFKKPFRASISSGKLPNWRDAVSDLEQKHAFAFSRYGSQENHMLVATGYATRFNVRMLEAFDPREGDGYRWLDYADWRFGNERWRIGRAYYKVVHLPNPSPDPRAGTPPASDDGPDSNPDSAGDQEPAQHMPNPEREATDPSLLRSSDLEAAESGIPMLRELGQIHPASLGFTSCQEARDALLTVDPCSRLEAMSLVPSIGRAPALVPQPFKVNVHLCIYRVDHKAVGKIDVVAGAFGKWRPVSYQGPGIAKAIGQVKDKLASIVFVRESEEYLLRRTKDGHLASISPSPEDGRIIFRPESEVACRLSGRDDCAK